MLNVIFNYFSTLYYIFFMIIGLYFYLSIDIACAGACH